MKQRGKRIAKTLLKVAMTIGAILFVILLLTTLGHGFYTTRQIVGYVVIIFTVSIFILLSYGGIDEYFTHKEYYGEDESND